MWDQVRFILSQGMVPEITVTEPDESMIALHKRGPGRPQKPDRFNWLHYSGTLLPGKRPVCKAKGCSRWLRRDQKAWCSQDCEDKGLADLNAVLALIEPQQLEDLIRNNVDMDFRVVKTNREFEKKKRPRRPRRFGYPVYRG